MIFVYISLLKKTNYIHGLVQYFLRLSYVSFSWTFQIYSIIYRFQSITRELAGVALRCAFILTAKREQRRYRTYLSVDHSRMGEGPGSFSNLEGGTPSVSSRTFFSSSGNSRHKTNPNSMSAVNFPGLGYSLSDTNSTSSPFIWYRDCLIESIRAQSESAPLILQEQSSHVSIHNSHELFRYEW